MRKYIGTFISNAKGFGFVEIEGHDQDVFIPESEVNGAFLSDVVEVLVKDHKEGTRPEGMIASILVRGMTQVVGTWQSSRHYGFVVPDNKKIPEDIFVPIEKSMGAVSGDKVVVTLTNYGNPSTGQKPEGAVKEIIGNINDPGVDILSIVKGYDLPTEFPDKVMKQAAKTPNEVSEADREGRLDLRDMTMVTIDGEDTKDIDDAVSLSVDEEGLYHLGVHIADVTNYVQEKSALDKEALKRGTSVYLVDRVIPMLPHKLSNGICSLNMGEDRLALSCLMTINAAGEVIEHQIAETVINVNERMTYTSVQKILVDKDKEEIKRYKELVPMFRSMRKLAKILNRKRKKRGAIDFDFPEAKIILDPEGNPIDIFPYAHTEATGIIEEFMLAANETVAKHFREMEMPFVYRIHEQPDPEKIGRLSDFVANFGYRLKVGKKEITPKDIQRLLTKIKGTEEEAIITRIALRSMTQAKYSTEPLGHFGLAATDYCHFTSPIRRYPDLQIHRIIKDILRNRMTPEKRRNYVKTLPNVADHASRAERIADEAERETDKLKKAQFMEQHIGEKFEGVISGVTGFGLFVELPNTCEGFIPAAAMSSDYFIYDEANLSLVGEKTGKVYRLGQTVGITVVDADRQLRTVDFRLQGDGDTPYRPSKGKMRRSSGGKNRSRHDAVPMPGKKKRKKAKSKKNGNKKKISVRMDGSARIEGKKNGRRSKKADHQ